MTGTCNVNFVWGLVTFSERKNNSNRIFLLEWREQEKKGVDFSSNVKLEYLSSHVSNWKKLLIALLRETQYDFKLNPLLVHSGWKISQKGLIIFLRKNNDDRIRIRLNFAPKMSFLKVNIWRENSNVIMRPFPLDF